MNVSFLKIINKKFGRFIVLNAFLTVYLNGVYYLSGLSASDFAALAWAEAKTNPVSITLKWTADTRITNYVVYRKEIEERRWSFLTNLEPSAVFFTDTNVEHGRYYEYKVVRQGVENNAYFSGVSYILSGIEVPPFEQWGSVLLLVEKTIADALTSELNRFHLDLVGDGWNVICHEVYKAITPTEVKAIITNYYFNSPIPLKAVCLLGRIPVPYSGMIAPDGHSDHVGAWPADVYYADIDGEWTDSSVNYTNASNPRLTNIPDDGKFDQNQLPSDTELWIGRIDLSNMTAFSLSEVELIRKYLQKNHNFRFNIYRFQKKAVIDDNFGEFGSEAFSASAWRDFTAFFGRANVVSGDYFSTLTTGAYLWSYGCGAGSFTSASGVGTTAQFSTNQVYTAFTMLFGSYHGDWDSPNNFMRAALCYPSYGLTCGWSGRPHWHCHHMAMGFPIGYSAWISQNNTQLLYEDTSHYKRYVHIALMGDPTLRMHVVSPPSDLRTTTLSDGSVYLSWNRSVENVAGYIVYGADQLTGVYTRLHEGFILETNFIIRSNAWNYYMVRAVKLETSASGTYFNLSQGIFQTAPTMPPLEPQIFITNLSDNSNLLVSGKIKIAADFFDPSRAISRVIFYNGNLKLGEASAPPYEITWENLPGGNFSIFAIAEVYGTNVVRSTPFNIAVYQPFIEKESVWKYLDDGSDAGTAWRLPEFDDSNWKIGQAELGYSNAPVTVVSFGDDPQNKYITTYFRKKFTVQDLDNLTKLILGIKRDDGAVVYINGVEVCRENMPAGEINYRTLALTAVGGEDESKFFTQYISPLVLRRGENLIAVEIHQSSPSSSDLSFDLFLYGDCRTPEFKLSVFRDMDGTIKLFYPNLSPLIKIHTKQTLIDDKWTQIFPYVMQSQGCNTFTTSPETEAQFFRLAIE